MASPLGPGFPVRTGAVEGRSRAISGRAGLNPLNSGSSAASRPAVSGSVWPRNSNSAMSVWSSPHSTCAFRSWLKAEVEIAMPRS